MFWVAVPSFKPITLEIVQAAPLDIKDLPYPTVSICAVQHPERWNLPWMMLNRQSWRHQDLNQRLPCDLAEQEWLLQAYLEKADKNLAVTKKVGETAVGAVQYSIQIRTFSFQGTFLGWDKFQLGQM